MERPVDLDCLVSFDAIAAHGGLSPAVRATGRPKATLSRHLAELELQLGVRLMERGKRLRLTAEGQRLHDRSHGLLLDLADAARSASDGAQQLRGRLRVSAPLVLAHVVLTRTAVRFCGLYPDIHLELVAEDRQVDPVEDGYDLAVRINPAVDERLIGRRVATDRRLVVAPPSMPIPRDVSEAAPPGVLMVNAGEAPVWRLQTSAGEALCIRPQGRLRLSSLLMVRDAALAGAGVALLPELLVRPDLRAGRLVLWGWLEGPPVEIWALHAARRLASPKVSAFIEVLADDLSEDSAQRLAGSGAGGAPPWPV